MKQRPLIHLKPIHLALLVTYCLFEQSISTRGQGTILFDTRLPGVVDARVTFPFGGGVGEGWKAQLFGARPGQPWVPLLPATSFRTSSDADMGYVIPTVVTVQDVTPGERYAVYLLATGQQPFIYAVSNPIILTLGGSAQAPAALIGMNPSVVVPEPSTGWLLLTGATFSISVARWFRHRKEGAL